MDRLAEGRVTLPLIASVVVAASWTPALACVPAPNQRDVEKAYYRSTVSVYRAVARNFVAVDPRYPDDNFTVDMVPVEAIWGQRPPKPFTLEFRGGMCSGWSLEFLQPGETFNGRDYFVFAAPAGQKRSAELRIIPANEQPAAIALVTLGRLQESGGGPPQLGNESLPVWPPAGVIDAARTTPLQNAISLWPWFLGLGTSAVLIGLAIGFRRKTKS